ncbi:Maf family nucleotide pyrophosphatase [Geofilum rubicundum]|uniref:dTTP/UTP pyrophosphatase n=1 Tax=Geofilum rubicundum JCM 15548 TaxID=1236989 RepID=A0A0E9LRY9_9BACT|nr:Maf family nucleotide pyrophosphatase [Geofilum rubicundum]GAO27625.1 septum formation protein Maf [Geofilum rubicundum JCM 15548]
MLDNLKDYTIILASQSPRRQDLLKMAHVDFEVVVVPDVPEDFPAIMPVEDVPEYLASQKQKAYAHIWSKPQTLVITADTIVELKGQVLNKPAGRQEAIQMLQQLSGARHRVLTGVVLKSALKQHAFTAVTDVWFKELNLADIEHYVDTCQPFDKAGAYGVQEWIGLIGVSHINGSFYNVMGLPVAKLFEELRNF